MANTDTTNGGEKLFKQLLRESWLTIALLVCSALFTSGITYNSITTSIKVNAEQISNIKDAQTEQLKVIQDMRAIDKADLEQRLDQLEKKIDENNSDLKELNRYLRIKVVK